MSQNKRQLESLKELQSVRLSAAARTRIQEELQSYAKFHAVAGTDTKHYKVKPWWRSIHPTLYSLPVIALVLLVVVSVRPAQEDIIMTKEAPLQADMFDSSLGDEPLERSMSTMMAAEPIPAAQVLADTESRISGLQTVLDAHQGEFPTETYTRLTNTLARAHALAADAETKSTDDEILQTTYEAADLAGQVESELSLLGTVTIDPNTGAIIDIDLSTPPSILDYNTAE